MEMSLRLSPSQVEPVRRWIATFCRKEKYWISYPAVKGTFLQIHALCFPFLLAYANETDSNEFDIQRLKQQGKIEIERCLAGETCPNARRGYVHALENLASIQVGEFLEKMELPNAV